MINLFLDNKRMLKRILYANMIIITMQKNKIDLSSIFITIYLSFCYTSLVGILVLFTDWLIVGFILFLLVPLVTTLYVTFAKSRVYWIVNGYELTESTFVNKLISYDEKFNDVAYRLSKIKFNKKKSETKIKLEFSNVEYQEKEELLKLVVNLCKEKCKVSNKVEVKSIIINSIFILIMVLFIFFALFT